MDIHRLRFDFRRKCDFQRRFRTRLASATKSFLEKSGRERQLEQKWAVAGVERRHGSRPRADRHGNRTDGEPQNTGLEAKAVFGWQFPAEPDKT